MYRKRGGAVEACWAHNPEDGGSKPLSAKFFIIIIFFNISFFKISYFLSINNIYYIIFYYKFFEFISRFIY